MGLDKAIWGERRSGRKDRHGNDRRPEEERDRSRIIHCASFRRLQGKTQVLGITESDFHRTRLTHSMEVAQIGRGIVYQLQALYAYAPDMGIVDSLPTPALIETIGFGHDLGHPPFGHSGEIALNYMMRNSGGFEGNGQSLRISARLELHTETSEGKFGLDLSRRALLGILKYPAPFSKVYRGPFAPPVSKLSQLRANLWKPPKCYLDTEQDLVEWLLKPLSAEDRDEFLAIREPVKHEDHAHTIYKSIDTSIMELADDIAYGIHDLEDGIALRLINCDHWEDALKHLDSTWANQCQLDKDWLSKSLFDRPSPDGNRKLAIGALVNAMVTSVRIHRRDQFTCPLLAYAAELLDPAETFRKTLTKLTKDHIIRTQNGQTLEYRGRQIVMSLFEALESDWEALLPEKSLINSLPGEDPQREICDYVAGMTDNYAIRMYERLFMPRQGSIFERL